MGISGTLSTFPNFLVYFVSALVLTGLFLLLYTRLTPHEELRLIREGNVAAAIALDGALIGFVIPLASVIAHSASLADTATWGGIALIVQLGGFVVARMLMPQLPQSVASGKVSDALFLAGLSIALGILDAACMSG